ncbi:T9SS sorting signal type C domain-containing protein [Flavobacterium sp. N1736]|uniref:T9SS sorting signal type C domain-containing protein n=1 Tax=Flavobacterium sp. N1736 TaxID=2986823 RepID=UPI0022252CC8|nr:T9SS sorting signal type C domain-containing protein [Flavobacterium sp. N1736]
MFFVASFTNAATRYSVNSGSWNSPLTWSVNSGGASGASVPVAGDIVYIEGHTITVTADAACTSITFRGTATNTLTVNSGFTLTVSGAITGESAISISRSAIISGAGTLNSASVTVGTTLNPTTDINTAITSTISNFNITGNLTLYGSRSGGNVNNAAFYLQSGTVNLDGQLTTTNENGSNTSTFSMATGAQSGTLLLGATNSPFTLSGTGLNTISLNGTGATVNYDRAGNQTIYNTTYNNLITSGGSGTKTLAAATIVNGNLSTEGGTTLATGNFGLTLGGNFTNGGGITAGSSAITLAGTSNQSIAGFTTTGNVTMTKTGGTATFTGNVSGNTLILSGSNGTLNLGTRLSHSFLSVTLTNGTLNGGASIINLSATNPFSGTATNFLPATGTVNLNGAAQNTLRSSFYNLTLSGSGTKTFSAITTITNILTITGTAKATLGSFGTTHTAAALVTGALTRSSGVYGGTTSSAPPANILTAYFNTATSIVTISTDSCMSFAGVAPITKVTLNSLSSVTSETSTTAYENIPSGTATTTLNKGDYYSLVVKGNTTGDVNIYYTAFFDWNGDGDFVDSGEGPIDIGTIRNSSGIDEKAASVYFQVPPGATGTSIKMRIIGLLGNTPNSTPCTVNASTGQVEDYTITLQSGCTGVLPSPVSTASTASTVCPNVPFTLSLGNTFSDGATYLWESSSLLTGPWSSSATPTIAFFNSNFNVDQASGSTVGNIAIYGGTDTQITGGVAVLTDTPLTGHNGGLLIDKANTANITPFTVTYKYRIEDGGTVGADGLSLSYGGGFAADAGGGESGEGSGLRIQFDTYDNEGVAEGSRVRILYNNTSIFNTAINAPFNLRTATYKDVNLYVDTDGYLTLGIQNPSGTMETVVSKLLLPGFAAADKTTWKFKFSARTGGSKDKHSIDDLNITFLDSANSKAKFTTSQTVKTYYRATITCGASSVISTPVLVDMTSAVITTQPAAPLAVCSGAGTRSITVAATGSGLTYSWRLAGTPVVNGGVISGQGTNTLTLTNPTGTNAGNYDVVINGACSSTVTSTPVTVVVNPLPTPTFTAQPLTSTCIGTSVTYTTEPSMSNYVWGFPGVAGTDYAIVSGGTAADNTVTLTYKTTGSKTVTINYKTVPNGCTAVSATSSSAVTVNALPTPTFTAQPLTSTCIGSSVTYTTEPSMSNYVWGFPGIAGTDYAIVSGGTAADNTVTLTYKTTGSKTVTINYKTVPNGCTAVSATSSSAVTVNALPTPTFTAQPLTSTCIGTSVTYTTEPSMSNYVWGFPGVAGTDYAIVSGGTAADNTVTLTYKTTGSKTITINYKTVPNGCTAVSATSSSAVTVNALPTPTFTAQPLTSTCIGSSVTYTTEPSMSNYVWGFPGVAGTDYAIVSGGTAADNTVTLTYKTTGSKTVTINYKTIPNGCTAVSATSSSAVTVNALPTPTFTAQPLTSTCIGTSVTYTTEPSMSNYVWGFSGIAGTDYAIVSGGTAADNTVTLTYKTTGSKTVTINYKTVPNGCTAVSATSSSAVTINALPTPTFTAQPLTSTCIGTSVTYTTEPSMSNYVWGFPGIAGTDYAIVSGGTAADNTVTLTYKTTGSKTVTINYKTVPNGCTAVSATSSSAVTVNALPTPTFTAQPLTSTCIGTSVTYTTEPSMSNYVWGFPGVAGTDYAIVSGGTAADNTVTLTYKTTGSKTVTINYKTVPNGCTAVSATSSSAVTVNALPTPTFTAQPLTSTCIGTSVTYTTEPSMSNYVWGFSGVAGTDYAIVSGGTAADNTVTLTYKTTGSKTVTINYKTVPNGCTAVSATSSSAVTVNPLPTAPTVGTPTDITCTTLGSVTLTNLPAGSWTIYQTGFASNTIYNSGTSYTVTGLAAGTYQFTVSNGTCTSIVSSDAIITDQSSTTWNGSVWSNGIPDTTKAAIIAGAFTVSADLNACSLTINPGIAITVPSNRTLNIVNGLTVTPTASLTFDNHSSLVQVNNNGVNSGKITYNRITAQIRRADFTYWSTPVSPQKLIDVSPLTLSDKYFGFNGDNWVSTNRNNNMVVGKGYIIRGPQTYSTTAKADYTAPFIGVPNNGIIAGETMTAGKYYLVGNPYPSALNAKKFLDDNLFLDGTLYFWTHNTPVVLSGAYQYSSTDYASYNLTGGVATSESALSGSIPGNNNAKPSGNVGAGQSFFISATTAGTVTFNNGMRLGAANNSQFFKSAQSDEKHRVWLNMTNAGGAFKQMLVGYVAGATNEYEKRYDGVSFDANPYLDFYSVANGNNYVIQARALPFEDTDLVPLGYRTTIAGDFTISIDEADGDLTSQNIYIEDKKTNTIYNLKTGKYTFTTEAGTFADRLVLRYTNKTLGTGDFENVENGLLVSVKDKTVKVTSSKENIKEVTIFDVTGKLLYNKKKVGTSELQIQNLQSSNQVLLVKVTLDNDFTTTKKIIFN